MGDINKNLDRLKRENRNYEYAQKISKLGSWSLDIKKNELFWSNEIFNIFELEKDKFEASYEAFLNAIHPDDRDMVNYVYSQSLKNKTPYSMEHRLLMKDKRVKWVIENCETEYDEKGNPIISYGTVQDITKEYELSLELERSNKKLKNTQNSLNKYVSYIRLDTKQRIIDASKAFCNIIGCRKKELLGKTYESLFHPDMDKQLLKNLFNITKTKNTLKEEIKTISKKNAYLWMETSISPEFNENNKFIGYVCIKNDITSKKEFEKQQIQLFAQSKMASMGEMIGNISHQWRQPLSAISTLATGMKLKKEFQILEDKELLSNLETINEYTQYLSKTIETFKNFLKENKVFKKISLQKEISRVFKILEPSLLNKHITLINKIYDIEEIKIDLIPDELSQVIINILSNAQDALIERKIRNPWIKINLEKFENMVRILIEDNAKGIEEKILNRIFEPYFTTKHKNQGTGLGLYMSHRIITESLKGKFYGKNTKNGACFIIELPF